MDFSSVINFFVSFFPGFLLGVFLEKPIINSYEYGKKRLKIRFNQILNYFNRYNVSLNTKSANFSIGVLESEYVLIEGDGKHVIKDENFKLFHNSHMVEFPEDLRKIRSRIENEQELAKQEGRDYFWNGKLYGLENYTRSRTDYEEDIVLNLWFYSSDYYTHRAASSSLNVLLDEGRTVRQKYLSDIEIDKVVPQIATAFGAGIFIITSDNKLVIAKRGYKNVGPWKGHFNVTVNEGFSRVSDIGESNQPDLHKCIIRGASEELNIKIDRSSIIFLSFGYEKLNYEWGCQGYARVKYHSDQIKQYRTSGVKDKWENEDLIFIRFDPDTVIQFFLDNGPWTPFATVCIFHTLINAFGREEVLNTLEKAQKQKKRNPAW